MRDQPSPERKADHVPHNGDQQVLGESCDDGGDDDGPRQIGVGPGQIQGLAVRNQRGRNDDGGQYGRQYVSQSVLMIVGIVKWYLQKLPLTRCRACLTAKDRGNRDHHDHGFEPFGP